MTVTLELPTRLLAFAKEQADELNLSIEGWLLHDLERRRKLHQETEEFFRVRRERAIPGALQAALDRVPNVPPDPGDELE